MAKSDDERAKASAVVVLLGLWYYCLSSNPHAQYFAQRCSSLPRTVFTHLVTCTISHSHSRLDGLPSLASPRTQSLK
jgi:hypothetical protein